MTENASRWQRKLNTAAYFLIAGLAVEDYFARDRA